LLLNKKDKTIRTYINTANRNSDKMTVSRLKKIKFVEIQGYAPSVPPKNDSIIDKLGQEEFHSAVSSKDGSIILLFSKFDIMSLKIET
jgi:hypothetical protein